MSVPSNSAADKLQAEVLGLLCAIIKRELGIASSAKAHSTPPCCPRCGNHSTTRRGHDATGKQRYQCHACNRSFTEVTGSALSSTNIPVDTWLAFAECHVEKRALRDSASRCDISLKTAFYMRKRLNTTITRYSTRVKEALANPQAKQMLQQRRRS